MEHHIYDPNDPDSDNDGLTDGDEWNTTSTDPNDSDSDDDGLSDGDEVNTLFTDPNDSDTDDDGIGDGLEVAMGEVVMNFNPTTDSSVSLERARELVEMLPELMENDDYMIKSTSGDQMNVTLKVRDTDGLEKGWQSTNRLEKALEIRGNAKGFIKVKRK